MAPLPVPLNDLNCHFCCLTPKSHTSGNSVLLLSTLCSHMNREAHVAYNFNYFFENWLLFLKVTASHVRERKGKVFIYRLLYTMYISKRSGVDHTVLPANTPCLPFLRKRSPDGATPNWGKRHPIAIAAYYSSIDPEGTKGWVGLVGWPIADGLPT